MDNADSFINAKTTIYGILGHPLSHTLSPIMQNSWFQNQNINSVYLTFDIIPNKLEKAIEGFKTLKIQGLNVTLPHKRAIMRFLDEVDPLAKKIGAVNTLKFEDKELKAINTDALGAKKALEEVGFSLSEKNLLILGAGGASRALICAFSEELNKIIIANRTLLNGIELVKDLRNVIKPSIDAIPLKFKPLEQELPNIDILINTTPVGMYPNIKKSPISSDLLYEDLFVFDIVYNPLETQLIKDAKKKGCRTLGGLDMLINQGAIAFEWWTGIFPNINVMKEKLKRHLEM
ncbi:MAG: Shikimate dehydrogenase (NADP(+)) [Promethearchaeota archaeon]|nr:MAG: Shikimate dehydrogenase (NADP(+)) [Candidatus Lokiarchaeota archaeon]